MKIALGYDDVGIGLVDAIREQVDTHAEIELIDMSAPTGDEVEYYADVAARVSTAVATGEADRGILMCGTGLGMAMTACKIPGIRAATCHDVYSAERAIKSNNAQVLTMGSRVIGTDSAKAVLEAWLNSEWEEGTRSEPKVKRMIEVEKKVTTSNQ